MGEWPSCTIGDLIKKGVAQIQTGPFGSQLHSYDYVTSGVPVVPTEAIRERRIEREVCPQISRKKATELARHRLVSGDILFARRGVQATGHIGVVRRPEEGFICGTGAIRLRIAKQNEILCADFFSHLLADPASIDWFKFHAIGATMPNLNEGIIRDFSFQLPSHGYQRAVAAFLSSLDDKIELNRRMNGVLEGMVQAIFRDWFVDFGPVRRKMAMAQQGLASDPVAILGGLIPNPAEATPLAARFPDTLGNDGLPLGWEEREIGAVAEIVGGSTPSTEVANYWLDGGNQWATPKDLSKQSGIFLFATERQISQAGLAKVGSGLSPVGSVLLSSRAPIGYLAIASVPVAVNQGFIVLRPSQSLPTLAAYFWCKANMELIKSNANGSTFQEISKRNFKPLPVVTANPKTMAAFVEIAAPLMELVESREAENRALAETRDYLLPRLMSGKVSVADAERAVG